MAPSKQFSISDKCARKIYKKWGKIFIYIYSLFTFVLGQNVFQAWEVT